MPAPAKFTAGGKNCSSVQAGTASSSTAPAAIQSSRTCAYSSPSSNRLPPVWETAPTLFSYSRLAFGTARFSRRPAVSRVRRKWSPAGSNPNRLSRNPSFPRAAPWQEPMLQPVRAKTGITSLRNVTGGVTPAFATATGTSTANPA